MTIDHTAPIVQGEPVTFSVTLDGDPLADQPIRVNSDRVGRTDEDGRLRFRVPDDVRSLRISIEVSGTTIEEYVGVYARWGDDRQFQAIQATSPVGPVDYNPFGARPPPDDRFGLFAQWTQYLVGEDRFHPHLVEDWTHEDGLFTLSLSDAFTWGSGAPVTAADLAFQLEVYDAAEDPAARFVESARASGEFELTIEPTPDTHPDLLEYTVLPLLADVPPSNWRDVDWHEEPADVRIAEPDPSGPLALTDATSGRTITRVRGGLDGIDGHHLAPQYDFGGYALRRVDRRATAQESFIANDVDGCSRLRTAPWTLDDFPDVVRHVAIPAGVGMGLWFDHDSEPWNQRAVRQALLHSIDRAAVRMRVGETTVFEDPANTGLTAASRERWLGADVPERFRSYDERRPARRLLAEAGYEPGDIDGTLAYPADRSHWATASQTVLEQLQHGGWAMTGEPIDGSAADVFDREQFDVVAFRHTPSRRPHVHHPYFSLEFLLRGRYDQGGHFANYDPGVVSIGDETVDVAADLDRLSRPVSAEEQRRLVRRLAHTVNVDVPCAIVMEAADQSFLNGERFTFPTESPHLRTRGPQWWLPKVRKHLPGRPRYDGPRPDYGLLKWKE